MVKQPQVDNNRVRGGFDAWDKTQAGQVLRDDYFPAQTPQPPQPAAGKLFYLLRYRRIGRR